MKSHWHVSLHKSGQWHLKVHDTAGKQRIVLKSHSNKALSGSLPVGLVIAIPDGCLRKACDPDPLPEPNIWIDRPVYGGAVEIGISVWDPNKAGDDWPGKAVGSQLRAGFKRSESEVVGILTRYRLPGDPEVVAMNAKSGSHSASYEPNLLDSPERRGHGFGVSLGGAIHALEVAFD